MQSTLITNARIVNEGEVRQQDLYIAKQRIEKIGNNLSANGADQVIDAQGKYLIPGMIDDQVHFREPDMSDKGDIKTESQAAIAGGITSVMEMPNTTPATTTVQALEDKYQTAAQQAMTNFAFYLGASNDNLEVIKSLDPQSACGIKIFMGGSTGKMLVDDPKTLEAIFANAPILVATHCEDNPTITANEHKYRRLYGKNIPMSCHPEIRSREACLKSSQLAIKLARAYGTNLHVLHLTTAEELEMFIPGPIAGKKITAEACAHHLYFSDRDYPRLGSLIKCNPAIKKESDRLALLAAVAEDRIDIIATDHAPHTFDEKQAPYTSSPSGMPLAQHALLSILEQYHNGFLPLEKIIEKTSHNVAIRYNIAERGFIREGHFADLVLIDLDQDTKVESKSLLSKCGWSPFTGQSFKSTIDQVWVNGACRYRQGKVAKAGVGMRLQFERS